MDLDTIVYLIYDRTGRMIVLPTRTEAEECVIAESPHPGIEERPFRFVLENQPKALVRIYSQYYWAEELA